MYDRRRKKDIYNLLLAIRENTFQTDEGLMLNTQYIADEIEIIENLIK